MFVCAQVVSSVVRQRGASAYTELLPMLTRAADSGAMQAEVTCKVLGFLSEDLTVFEPSGGETSSGGIAMVQTCGIHSSCWAGIG